MRKAREELEEMRLRYEHRLRYVQTWATELRSSYEEGRRSVPVSYLRRQIPRRFGQWPDWLESWLSTQQDVEVLEEATCVFLEVSTLDEFRARLAKL